MTTTKHRTKNRTKHRTKNRTKHRIRSKRLKTKTKTLRKGGAAFDKGTFGCVFRPPLHCKQSSISKSQSKSEEQEEEESSEYISKFMTKEEADKEIKEMKNIKKLLLKSPNIDNEFINKYYILANEDDICEIDVTNKENIKDLDGAIPNTGILSRLTPKNSKIDCRDIYTSLTHVKKNNHEYRSLNLIDGGSSLYNYLLHPLTEEDFNKLNEQLIDLLQNGIYTMNKLGIYHCDLKPENLVYKDKRVRMIDWGFAVIIDKKEQLEKNIKLFKNLEIMYYGLPFTNILLLKDIEQGRTFFKEEAKQIKGMNERDICREYYKKIYTGLNPSPYFSILNTITPRFLTGSGKTLTDYAIDNLVDVIFSDLTNEKFFYDVFLPNADIFAFLQIYIKISKAFIDSSPSITNIKQNIINLLNKYILTADYANKPYPISEIIKDLRQLNKNNPISSPKQASPKHASPKQETFSLTSPKQTSTSELSKQLSKLHIGLKKAKGISQRKQSPRNQSHRKQSRRKY